MTNKPVKIVLAGGGTGGHLYPAIAIAAEAVKRFPPSEGGVEIVFVGTPRGIETQKIPGLGYRLRLIAVRGLVRTSFWRNLLFPFALLRSLLQAGRILEQEKPDLVIGTGGYVAYPVLWVAVRKKILTLIQEQNSYPGIATRRLAKKVQRVFLAYGEASVYLKRQDNIVLTGNPVRPEIRGGDRVQALKQFRLDPQKKTVLILGGSQGAESINRAILQSLSVLERFGRAQLIWQTGKKMSESIRRVLGNWAVTVRVFDFIDSMAEAYAVADLVVSRAGAIALAEITACGKPAILIPYPYAAADHQRHNAVVLSKAQAAELILDRDLGRVNLGEQIVRLLKDEKQLGFMAQQSKALAKPEAARQIVEIAYQLLQSRGRQTDFVTSTQEAPQGLLRVALKTSLLKG